MKIEEKPIKARAAKLSIMQKGEEVARCFIYLIKNELHEQPYALLEDVFVDEKFRNRGLGTRLVRAAIEKAKALKCYKIIATSRFERKAVHRWYRKLGFKKFGLEFRMDL
jgi:GNAT superfamily N-acetyltransferase